MSQQGVPGFPQGNSLYPNSSQGKTPGLPVGDMGTGETAVTARDAVGNPVISQGNLNQRRKKLAEAFAASPLVPIKAWTAGEVVTIGTTRMLSNGFSVVAQVAGTCGTVEPVFNGYSRITASVTGTTSLVVTAVAGDRIGIGSEIISGGVTQGALVNGSVTSGSNVFTVNSVTNGQVAIGQKVVISSTVFTITAQGTGTGGTGTYTLSANSPASESQDYNLSGTIITGLGTATGGAGTYTISGNRVATIASIDMAVVTNQAGRRAVDNTVTWELDYWTAQPTVKTNPPVVTWQQGANRATVIAALGMVRIPVGDFNDRRLLNPAQLRAKCGVAICNQFKVLAPLDYRKANNGSYTAFDADAAAVGFPSGMERSTAYEFTCYITDSKFGFEFITSNDNGRLVVEVDGYVIEGDRTATNNANQQIITIDFGEFKRRKVCIRNSGRFDSINSILLTPNGSIAGGEASTDTILMFSDSILNTYSPDGSSAYQNLPYLIQKKLGFDACVAANAGGTGYVAGSTPTRLMNVPDLIEDPTNQALFPTYSVNHVLFLAGLNDGGVITSEQIRTNALRSFNAIRKLLPNVKVTVADTWFQSTTSTSVGDTILAAFNEWGDENSRFISFSGRTGRAPFSATNATSIISINSAISTGGGAKGMLIGLDEVHPPASAHQLYAQFIVDEIRYVWGDNY